MQPFERPAVLLESHGQIIEQFRVSGAVTQQAEVAESSDETTSEVRSPDSIHNHSCRHRIAGIHDRFGQLLSSAAIGEVLRAGGKNGQESSRGQRSFVVDVAADEHVEVR